MIRAHRLAALAFALLLPTAALPVSAQSDTGDAAHALVAPTRTHTGTLATPAAPPADTIMQADWSVLRVAKWGTAAAATGVAAWGVISNRRADDRFEELERVCVDQPARCVERTPDGAYADEELEQRYQDVRALDRRARTALVAGQVGIAASVVLFLLDLRNSAGPENIPYEPRRIDVAPARDGGLSLRMNVSLPAARTP